MADLLSRISVVAIPLGALALFGSVLRIPTEGWHLNIIGDLSVFAVVVAVLLLRRRLPERFSIITVSVSLAALGLISYATLGLVTAGGVVLTGAIGILGVFFGFQVGICALLASVIALVATAYADLKGWVPGPVAESVYIHSISSWATHIGAIAVFCAMLLVSIATIQKHLRASRDEENRASSELEKSEQKYRLLAENMRDVMVVQDSEMNITYASPSVKELFGYTPEEIVHLPLSTFLTKESLERAVESHREFLSLVKSQKASVDVPLMEFEYIRKDGTTFWGELKPTFVFDKDGNINGSQGVIRDITERRNAALEKERLLEQLRHSEKLTAIGRLAGGVAHDFNNQLAGILGLAELISKCSLPPERASEFAGDIVKTAERASKLTQKLLDFSRREVQGQVLTDLHERIREVVGVLERSTVLEFKIRMNLGAVFSAVRGDPSALENALLNLALNSRDAMPKGGVLTFSTSDVQGQVNRERDSRRWIEVKVEDTGTGMSEETARQAFEPFFTTKPMGKGTGMGLAAVYSTVRSHGGTIVVDSRLGVGTVFTIRLPSEFPSKTGLNTPNVVPPIMGRGHVLLIDDETTVLRTTTKMLEALGYEVTAAQSAEVGLRLFRDAPKSYACVLLDLILQDGSGRGVYEDIVKTEPNAQVVFFSGYNKDPLAQALIDEGKVGFLPKPADLESLSKAIAKSLAKFPPSVSTQK